MKQKSKQTYKKQSNRFCVSCNAYLFYLEKRGTNEKELFKNKFNKFHSRSCNL